ncbi:hypothetical protein HGO34_03115 [Agrobacterium vitis]|uniref:Uncharacterized protein n=1 Tax=Agrobacterium vitis TaxID=373 RepID=A0AAE4W8V7_AGRVI|nr:hypothetical protein [Agrobacterium vitis]MCF1497824.1 hypothetical protein [Allorhizobium sp. Av2]MCM2438710.1 hypothetical protein [Agrobacterium vitis]MUZ55964.1 hypothetical protein [Agrobacterium vitis]MVA64898.1 hypothetical protein [Agrobacterium vitis]MVA85869.1 hypothetical protein [Agrobacterium vitis]
MAQANRKHIGLTIALAVGFAFLPFAAHAAVEKRADSILVSVDKKKDLLFLPLVPTIVRNGNGTMVVNIFVRQGSFGELELTVAPTIKWELSKGQEAALGQMKKEGVKTFAAWPDVVSAANLYQIASDGELRSSSKSVGSIVIGANRSIEFSFTGLQMSDVRDLLHGKREWGVIFLYETNVHHDFDDLIDPRWIDEFRRDLRTFGELPVDGAVEQVFSSLRDKYAEDFRVPQRALRAVVERYVKSAPIFVKEVAGTQSLVHDLSGYMEIDIPSQSEGASSVRDYYQGTLAFGDFCSEANSTIFVTLEQGSTIGCEALEE